jgi:hypothetical protein
MISMWKWGGASRSTVRHVLRMPSGHTGNIFGARFVPLTQDHEVVTCAMDGRLLHHNLETRATRTLREGGDIMQGVEMIESEPWMLWHAGTARCRCCRSCRACVRGCRRLMCGSSRLSGRIWSCCLPEDNGYVGQHDLREPPSDNTLLLRVYGAVHRASLGCLRDLS